MGFPISHPSEKTSTANTINITPEGMSAVVWLHPALVHALVCALVCMLVCTLMCAMVCVLVCTLMCAGVCDDILFVL